MANNIFSLNQPPIYPVIYPDENPIAYLARLAHLNQYSSINWLIKHDENKLLFLSYASVHDITLSTQQNIKIISPTMTEQSHISPVLLNRRYLRYCPCCLQEANYYRMSWQLKASLVCLKHQQILLEHCPRCYEKISLTSGQIGFCQCGHNLANSPVSAANQWAINLQNFLEGNHTPYISTFTQEDIEQLTISERISFITRMTRWPLENTNFLAITQKYQNISITLLLAVADIFFSTKELFLKYLFALNQREYIRQTGTSSAFTAFYKSSYNIFTNSYFHVYKNLIEAFIISNYNNYIPHYSNLSNAHLAKNHPWVTLKNACKLTKISPFVIRRAIKDNKLLSVPYINEGRYYTLIYRDSLRLNRHYLTNLLTLQDTKTYLSITQTQLYELLNNNLIPGAIPPKLGYSSTWYISKKSLNDILYQLDELSSPMPYFGLTFNDATNIVRSRISYSFAQLLQAILNKEIIIGHGQNHNESGFQFFRISKTSLESWIQKQIRLQNHYTIPELTQNK